MSPISGAQAMWPNYTTANIEKLREPKSTLGKDEFLQILVSQLANQDPMQPLQDREFIAQMAQFSSVEQIMNMSEELGKLRQSMGISSDLIGKEISYTSWNQSEMAEEVKSGVVEGITMRQGLQYANVNGQDIPLESIVKIALSGLGDPNNEPEGGSSGESGEASTGATEGEGSGSVG
ncbi:flagellar hook capping FlgD N-terminal domain-containing protein [Marinicrinis sediminis]|uniref:Flagellar hook capping FlgD N-terminal domain-containing protein n=1 Tax=Marinicrinis sediminis TaxID=1652465 RepID=A0ABW5R5R6_9BACL